MSDTDKTQFTPAPDFELADSEGRKVRLSDYRGKKDVVLVFNRGFG
jgi:peroxiredoxin